MGTGAEAFIIPALISAAGAGVNYYNSQNTAKQQDQALANQIRMQSQIQQKANARTSQLVQNQAQQTDVPQKQASQQLFAQQLAANQPQALNPLKSVGDVSQAYQQAGADAQQGITNYGQQQGNLMGSIIAPTQQRRDNQTNLDNYGVDIGNLKTQLQGQDFLSQLKLNAIRPNPWLSALGGLATGVGGAMSGNAMTGALLSSLGGSKAAPVNPYSNYYANNSSNTPDYLQGVLANSSYPMPYGGQ